MNHKTHRRAVLGLLAAGAATPYFYGQAARAQTIGAPSLSGGLIQGALKPTTALTQLRRFSAQNRYNNCQTSTKGEEATTGASGTGTTATLTYTDSATTYYVGQVIIVSGVTPTGYNGSYVVTAASNGSVSYANTTTGAQSVAGTIVGLFPNTMANPPTLSWGSSVPAALTNGYAWTTGTLYNFYSGVTYNSAGYKSTLSTTVSGSRSNQTNRFEVNVDSAKCCFAFYLLSSANSFRVIVNGQFVSPTVTSPGSTGYQCLTLDFTAVGGRQNRNIVIESEAFFSGVFVLPTEGVYEPEGDVVSIAWIGDSYSAGGGVPHYFYGFNSVACDLLGARNNICLGIGSTGWLANASGAQTTARGRIPDAVYTNPNIVCVCMGHNDTGYSSGALQTEVGLFLTTFRQNMPSTPLIVFGVFNGNVSLSACQTVETAVSTAFSAWSDNNSVFIPVSNDANGAWFTGSGQMNSPTGTGNCDDYIFTDGIHPNITGHYFLGARVADAITRVLPSMSPI